MNVNFSLKHYQMQHLITGSYLMAMFSFFLLYMQDGYFNLTASKLYFFTFATAGLIFITMLLQFSHIRKVSCSWSIRFSPTDWAMLCLLASHCITTMLSVSPLTSIDGSQGRGTGLLFTCLLTGMYFIVSRTYHPHKGLFLVWIISTDLIILLGLGNFFGYDPLHVFALITAEELPHYLSTIGNITFFAHLMILVLPFCIYLYLQAQKRSAKCFFAISILLEFMGIYISNLDGAYLGLAVICVLLIMQCTSYEKTKYCISLFLLAFLGSKLLYLSSIIITSGRSFITLSHVIVHSPLTTICLLICLVLFIMMQWQKAWFVSLPYRHIRNWILGVMIGGFIFILGCFCYFSIVDQITPLGVLENILRFSDRWGHGRGFIWKSLIQILHEHFSFMQYLFGYGLDSIRSMMTSFIDAPDILYYDNAHNEYLQYLMTSGIIGLFSYLWLIISLLVRLLHRKEHPLLWTFAMALIAHCAWALTGLNQPITTPIVFILIALGEGSLRNQEKL